MDEMIEELERILLKLQTYNDVWKKRDLFIAIVEVENAILRCKMSEGFVKV